MELSGLSLMTTKICSSFSRLMKLPNQDFLASSGDDSGVKLDISSGVGTCNFRRWKRGDPRKLFLIELSRVLHGIPPMLGLDGGVGLGVPAGLSFGVWTGVPLGVGRGLPLGEG